MDQEMALDIVREQDIRKRMEGGESMVKYLSKDADDLNWTNIDKIVDALSTQWVSSSNFKITLLGLDILNLLLGCIQKEFHLYYHLIQKSLVDRLGDSKDQVRDASITLLTNIMQASSTPQDIFEHLGTAFSHKVWRVRESVCRLLVATINRFGPKSLYLSRLLPHVCKLLADSNGQVRSTAEFTLGEMYRHVGEKVRQDVAKKGLTAAKLNSINCRFDEIRDSGKMALDDDYDMMRGSSITNSVESLNSMKSSSAAFIPKTPSSKISSYSSIPSRTASADGPSRPTRTTSTSNNMAPATMMIPPPARKPRNTKTSVGVRSSNKGKRCLFYSRAPTGARRLLRVPLCL